MSKTLWRCEFCDFMTPTSMGDDRWRREMSLAGHMRHKHPDEYTTLSAFKKKMEERYGK